MCKGRHTAADSLPSSDTNDSTKFNVKRLSYLIQKRDSFANNAEESIESRLLRWNISFDINWCLSLQFSITVGRNWWPLRST